MNNNVNISSSSMELLQCTSQIRNAILPYVDQIYNNAMYTEGHVNTDKSFRATSKQAVPKLYHYTGIVTMFLCILGFFFMFIDAIWMFLGLNSSVYTIWCLCCLSLFMTNKIALKEWKSINE